MKIAFLFPGQGAQYIGMGKDLYKEYKEVRNVYEHISEILNIDLPLLCFNGIKKEYTKRQYKDIETIGDELNKTENAQIAIATMSLSILEILKNYNIKSSINAGLSLGEYTALINANYLSLDYGMQLLKKRGYIMQKSLLPKEHLMVAVIGCDFNIVEDICNKVTNNIKKYVAPANYNYSNQIVISGEKEAVIKTMEQLEEKGAKKLVTLKTSGAFHTRLLDNAKKEYENELESLDIKIGDTKVIKNIDGSFYNKEDNIKEVLAKHIISPVRFDKTINLMLKEDVNVFVEIGPGKTLTGFIKKEKKEANTINIYDVQSLKAGLEILK